MDGITIRQTVSALSSQEREQWIGLFQQCYGRDASSARDIFRKYELHAGDAWFCVAKQDGIIIACYSGVVLPFGVDHVFLATDTMSNGQLSNATVKLAEVLYPALKAAGIDAVCGYPNGNIIRIRERKLGWQMTGRLSVYVGLPLLWRLGRRASTMGGLWNLERPSEGFFSNRRSFISLLGRHGLYEGRACSLVVTLSARSPGLFFVKVPERLAVAKQFGWVLTNPSNNRLGAGLKAASAHLDLNTIDVP